jgi:tetratricopeptide (TPR) repeat protein
METRGGVVHKQNFSTRMAARILAISPARIRYWVRHKLVNPSISRGRHYQFTFEDLLMMRLTKELLPTHRRILPIKRAFERLPTMLDTQRPVTALKLYEQDGQILVRDGAARFEAETGQLLLGFVPGESVATVAQADFAVRSRRLLDAAMELEDSDPLRALKLYRDYLAYDPDNGEIHRRVSRLLELNGDLAGAIRHLDAAAAAEPDAAEVHFDRGVLYRKQGDLAAAESCFKKALEADPELIEAHLHLAEICEQQGKAREAFRYLSAAHRLMKHV